MWHSYNCGQTVGWIKMPLGKEIGLDPGHIVLYGDPVGTHPPQQPSPLRPMSIVAKRSPISATAELLSLLLLSAFIKRTFADATNALKLTLALTLNLALDPNPTKP